jgi:hypothetical protein
MSNDYMIGGSHYLEASIQPWDAMQSWMSHEQFVGFLRGNAIKYIARAEKKGGIEDYRKAMHYLEKLAEVLEQQQTEEIIRAAMKLNGKAS